MYSFFRSSQFSELDPLEQLLRLDRRDLVTCGVKASRIEPRAPSKGVRGSFGFLLGGAGELVSN